MKNFTLTGDAFVKSADHKDVEDMRSKYKAITGSDIMPAVLYKGNVIKSGVLGNRKIEGVAPCL